MASDPRKFLVKQCGKKLAAAAGVDTARKDFFNSIGKVGDIELLNTSVLSGKVGKGLRDLSKISDSIRTGGNPSSAIPKNGSDVLIATGISQASAAKAGSFNPGVLNRATSAADQIADQVQNGQFSLSNIPNSFSDIQNLSTLVDGIFTNATGKEDRLEVCQASPYATDLIAYAPKYKFLFVVEFEFATEFAGIDGHAAAFVIKNSTRPQVNFEHEEMNMYNFWVRVPKRTSYEPMTMRFYDDNKNGAMHLYESYLKAVSPIANLSFSDQPENTPGVLEAMGMAFDAIGTQSVEGGIRRMATHGYAAGLGPLSTTGSVKNVFKRINMYHIFDYGRKMNTYRFLNPKVLSLELDELDMADNGNGNELSFQFAYDAVNIATDVPISDPKYKNKITQLTAGGAYPIEPNFGADAPSPDPRAGDPEEGGGFFNSIGAITGTATGAVSGALDFGTGVVSDAFAATSDFAGSIFSDFAAGASAAEASVKNAIKGDVPPSK